jgi:hypothetical protein
MDEHPKKYHLWIFNGVMDEVWLIKVYRKKNSMIEKVELTWIKKFIHEIMVARKDFPFIRDIHGHSGLQ